MDQHGFSYWGGGDGADECGTGDPAGPPQPRLVLVNLVPESVGYMIPSVLSDNHLQQQCLVAQPVQVATVNQSALISDYGHQYQLVEFNSQYMLGLHQPPSSGPIAVEQAPAQMIEVTQIIYGTQEMLNLIDPQVVHGMSETQNQQDTQMINGSQETRDLLDTQVVGTSEMQNLLDTQVVNGTPETPNMQAPLFTQEFQAPPETQELQMRRCPATGTLIIDEPPQHVEFPSNDSAPVIRGPAPVAIVSPLPATTKKPVATQMPPSTTAGAVAEPGRVSVSASAILHPGDMQLSGPSNGNVSRDLLVQETSNSFQIANTTIKLLRASTARHTMRGPHRNKFRRFRLVEAPIMRMREQCWVALLPDEAVGGDCGCSSVTDDIQTRISTLA